jgi:tRNA threonylcarbamoyladenosine biosynthesis protein TsaE
MKTVEWHVATAAEMEALGARLAAPLRQVRLLYVRGALGAGKTTLVRGMLRALGHAGAVKSPTFTLVEPYAFHGTMLYHFDLYRLNDPEELELIGIRDYLQGPGVCVVEWAERARSLLPAPDVDVMIETANTGRNVKLTAHTDQGSAFLDGLT